MEMKRQKLDFGDIGVVEDENYRFFLTGNFCFIDFNLFLHFHIDSNVGFSHKCDFFFKKIEYFNIPSAL